MPTTPRGLWSPSDSDDWDLTVDLAAMQNSADAAIGDAAGTIAKTGATIAALGSGTRVGQIGWVTSPAPGFAVVWSGSAWSPVGTPGSAGVPLFSAAGTTAVAASGTTTITFPAGRFTQAPIIEVTVIVHGGGVVSVPFINGAATTTGFSVRLFTLGGGQNSGTINWTATQMTSGSAAG